MTGGRGGDFVSHLHVDSVQPKRGVVGEYEGGVRVDGPSVSVGCRLAGTSSCLK